MFLVSVIQEPGGPNNSFASVFRQAEGGASWCGLETGSSSPPMLRLPNPHSTLKSNWTSSRQKNQYQAQRHPFWFMRYPVPVIMPSPRCLLLEAGDRANGPFTWPDPALPVASVQGLTSGGAVRCAAFMSKRPFAGENLSLCPSYIAQAPRLEDPKMYK